MSASGRPGLGPGPGGPRSGQWRLPLDTHARHKHWCPSVLAETPPSSPYTDHSVGLAAPRGQRAAHALPWVAATGPKRSAESPFRIGAPLNEALGDAEVIHTPTCTISPRYRCPHWETQSQAWTTVSTPGPSHSGASVRRSEMLTACWRLEAGPARGGPAQETEEGW